MRDISTKDLLSTIYNTLREDNLSSLYNTNKSTKEIDDYLHIALESYENISIKDLQRLSKLTANSLELGCLERKLRSTIVDNYYANLNLFDN